jgi:hypothetical protein
VILRVDRGLPWNDLARVVSESARPLSDAALRRSAFPSWMSRVRIPCPALSSRRPIPWGARRRRPVPRLRLPGEELRRPPDTSRPRETSQSVPEERLRRPRSTLPARWRSSPRGRPEPTRSWELTPPLGYVPPWGNSHRVIPCNCRRTCSSRRPPGYCPTTYRRSCRCRTAFRPRCTRNRPDRGR